MAAPANFMLSERALDDRTGLLSAEGDTNAVAAERLCRQVTSIAEAGKAVVIADLSAVTFVDSAVVSGLSDASRALRKRDSRLIVVEPLDPRIGQPFEFGTLDRSVILVPTLEAAGRAASLPTDMLTAAIPPPPEPPPVTQAPRRTRAGRRELDQEVQRELALLRRSVRLLEAEIAELRANQPPPS